MTHATSPGVLILAVLLSGGASAQLIYSNGPLITHQGAGIGGSDVSAVDGTPPSNLWLFGFLAHESAGRRVADDFTVPPGQAWNVSFLRFYVYQTGNVAAPTITGCNYRIWNGPPDASGTILHDFSATSQVVPGGVAFTPTYRVPIGSLTSANRHIMQVDASGNGISLSPGTYWIDWRFSGSTQFSGPWQPPITILGTPTTGNALEQIGSVWQPAVDTGVAGNQSHPQGLPFEIHGTYSTPACSAGEFGPLNQDPLTISGPWAIGSNCVLDFGTRHVILDATADVSVTSATIHAGRFTMQAGSGIGGRSATLTVVASGTSAGNLQLDGTIDVSGGCLGPGGRLELTSIAGSVSVTGILNATGGAFTPGGNCLDAPKGRIVIHASGDIQLGGTIAAEGASATADDGVYVTSDSGSIAAAGTISVTGYLGNGGNVTLDAARDVTVSGPIWATGSIDEAVGGNVHITAGQAASLGSTVDCGATEIGGLIMIDACRVHALQGSQLLVNAFFGAIDVTAGDLLEAQGLMWAGGLISLRTRLAAPYSPILNGAVFIPQPTIVHDNSLAPCLALTTTTLTGPSPLMPGNNFVVNLNAPPLKPLIVVAGLSLQHLPLQSLGWTQVNLFTALPLADVGVLGAPVAGSSTDATGHWGVVIPTLASATFLIGLTVYVEAFIFDIGALNGLFHQPPVLPIQFI